MPQGKGHRGRRGPEKRYWRGEAERFKREHPGAYRESRARTRIVKLMIAPWRVWNKARYAAADAWLELENHLLGGNINPRKVAALLETANIVSRYEAGLEQIFLERRKEAIKRILKKPDWNAMQRLWVLEDKISEINAERHLYGNVKRLMREGLFHGFAELISALRVGRDSEYASHRGWVARAAQGVRNQKRLLEKGSEERRGKFCRGEISSAGFVRDQMLAELAMAQQYFNLAEAQQGLYNYLRKRARDKHLKNFITGLAMDMAKRKARYAKEILMIEKEFRLPKGRGNSGEGRNR